MENLPSLFSFAVSLFINKGYRFLSFYFSENCPYIALCEIVQMGHVRVENYINLKFVLLLPLKNIFSYACLDALMVRNLPFNLDD